jgi:hypothetical protein
MMKDCTAPVSGGLTILRENAEFQGFRDERLEAG